VWFILDPPFFYYILHGGYRYEYIIEKYEIYTRVELNSVREENNLYFITE